MINYKAVVEGTIDNFNKINAIPLVYKYSEALVSRENIVQLEMKIVVSYEHVVLYAKEQRGGDKQFIFEDLLNNIVANGIVNHYLLIPKHDKAIL